MDELELNNEELEQEGGYTPSESSLGGDMVQSSDQYIPLSNGEETFLPTESEAGTPLDSSMLDVDKSVIDEIDKKISEDTTIGEKPDEVDGSEEIGRKCCPTRHGCQGATDCDYAYANYPF